MKKLFCALLAALLSGSILIGCSNTPQPASMALTPYSLTSNETDLIALAGADLSQIIFAPYAYEAGESLRSISVARYVLSDALEWERDAGYAAGVFDESPLAAAGRFSLTAAADEPFSFQLRADGTSYSYAAPALPDDLPESAACGVGTVSDTTSIVYGEEIPILVRTFRSQSELFVYDAVRDFADPSRFEGDLFTEAYTVTFSDEMPEAGSPIT